MNFTKILKKLVSLCPRSGHWRTMGGTVRPDFEEIDNRTNIILDILVRIDTKKYFSIKNRANNERSKVISDKKK
jgi:hypothetical protein